MLCPMLHLTPVGLENPKLRSCTGLPPEAADEATTPTENGLCATQSRHNISNARMARMAKAKAMHPITLATLTGTMLAWTTPHQVTPLTAMPKMIAPTILLATGAPN